MKRQTWQSNLYSLICKNFGLEHTFYAQDVYAECGPELAKIYPNNTTIDASIRHNLQRLRDRNLIDFVDYDGCYKLTLV